MDELWFWVAGNVVLPLLPVLITAVVLKVAGRAPSWISVAEDGVLFFYVATLSAVLLMDLARRALQPATAPGSGPAAHAVFVVGFVTAVIMLILATFGFSIAALGRAGVQDVTGRPLNLGWLAVLSWISAGIMAILVSSLRIVLGLF